MVVVNVQSNANSNSHIPVSVTLNRNRGYKVQVAEQFQRDKRYGSLGVDYRCYELTNARGQVVMGVPTIGSSEVYWFNIPQNVIPECASHWSDAKLQQLRIEFDDVTDYSELFKQFSGFNGLKESEDCCALKLEHHGLTEKMVDDFRRRDANAPLVELEKEDSLVLAILMAGKYRSVEALIDLFVCFLLRRLGFYKGYMFAFPQLRHSIHFGAESCDAIPAFTITDIRSFHRAFIFEEKKDFNSRYDTSLEAEVIAEAIAVYQSRFGPMMSSVVPSTYTTAASSELSSSAAATSLGLEADNVILGVKVQRTFFTFYSIPISDQILTALETCRVFFR